MSAISTILTRLRAAIWAIDVRDDIANAIEQCYSDVSNPTLQTEALEAALQNKIDEGEMAALTIGDHTITAAKLAQGVIDNTLTTSGAAADAAETGRQFGLIKADFSNQTGIISKTPGYYINLTTDPVDISNPSQSSTGLTYAVADCSEGDKFVINAVGATSGRAWGFLDSSNHVLSMADANATVTDLKLTAPTNAVKLIINDKGSGRSYKVGNNLATKADNILSDDIKSALLTCFEHVAWTDEHGRNYYKALVNTLYHWDYEWYASSMELPKGATYDSYDWTTEQGALILGGGKLDFNYIGDCEIEIVAKYNANYGLGVPRFKVTYEHDTDYKYINVVLDKTANDKHSYENTSGSYNSTGILFDEYHTYNITFNNGVGSVMIDGNLIGSGLGAISSSSSLTGISCWENDALTYYKSIKFRRL